MNGSVVYSYRSDTQNDFLDTIPLESFGTLDANVSVQSTSLPMSPRLSLIGKNLTDENTPTFGITLGPAQLVSLNAPRQVMVKLDVTF